jgi:hypothetical protein
VTTQSDFLTELALKFVEAFGGAGAILVGLVAFLAGIAANRISQKESAQLNRQLGAIAHELSLRESSYAKHLDLLLDYYAIFYRHYRLCQNAANQDAHRLPDGTTIRTKDHFFERLDDYLQASKAEEGKVRLVLPAHLLTIHDESIKSFNEFKDAMLREQYDEVFHEQKRVAFTKVHRVKEQLESGLRGLLRTEQLLKEPL